MNWKSFSTQRKIYDQIRYIDYSGDEKIRININNNQAYIVDENQLQNKKDRYYFYETVKLENQAVHVSQLDLNIERGEIEKPYKPMIRFSTPLYDDDNNVKGIIVLNYLAQDLLENFKEIGLNSRGQMILLNSDSYWLSSGDSKLEWGFMFDGQENNTFKKIYNKEWENIKNGNKQFITSKGLFTSYKFDLRDKISNKKIPGQKIFLHDDHLYIVSSVLRNSKYSSFFIDNTFDLILEIIKDNYIYFLIIFFVSSIVAFLFYLNRKTYSKIKYYSEFDGLTKVYNRRAGLYKLEKLLSNNHKNLPISLCFIDINGLKQVNDILGHDFGDQLIISVVDVIKAIIKKDDFLVRMGGDEFLIVLNGIDVYESEKIWIRIKNAYDQININENRPYLISVSHGIVSKNTPKKSELDNLIKLADEKMYKEKHLLKENLNIIR